MALKYPSIPVTRMSSHPICYCTEDENLRNRKINLLNLSISHILYTSYTCTPFASKTISTYSDRRPRKNRNGHHLASPVFQFPHFFHSPTAPRSSLRRSHQRNRRSNSQAVRETRQPTSCLLCGPFSRCGRSYCGGVQSAQWRGRVRVRKGGCELDTRCGRGVRRNSSEGKGCQYIVPQRRGSDSRSSRYIDSQSRICSMWGAAILTADQRNIGASPLANGLELLLSHPLHHQPPPPTPTRFRPPPRHYRRKRGFRRPTRCFRFPSSPRATQANPWPYHHAYNAWTRSRCEDGSGGQFRA